MLAQGLEGLLRSIGRRGEAVGAEADPREEGHECDVVKDPRVHGIPRFPHEKDLQRVGQDLSPRGATGIMFCGSLPVNSGGAV